MKILAFVFLLPQFIYKFFGHLNLFKEKDKVITPELVFIHQLFLLYLMCGPEADNRILTFIYRLLGMCGSMSFIFIIVSLYVEVDCMGRRKQGYSISAETRVSLGLGGCSLPCGNETSLVLF